MITSVVDSTARDKRRAGRAHGRSIGHYAFDTYETDVALRAQLDGEQVPARMLFANQETLFSISAEPVPPGRMPWCDDRGP